MMEFSLGSSGVTATLTKDFSVDVRGHHIVVVKGFTTDFASVPRFFWRIIPKMGKYSEAAVVHDYLYFSGIVSKEKADKIFYQLMKEAGVDWLTRKVMYYAVKYGGEDAWDRCRKGER